MTTHDLRLATVMAVAAMVAGCGGGGSSGGARPGVAPAPEPPPAPARAANAASGVIAAADTSQTFATEGSSVFNDGNLAVRYDAPTDQYFVTLPGMQEAVLLNDPAYDPATTDRYLADGWQVSTMVSGTSTDPSQDYDYSNLAHYPTLAWGAVTAFGMATPASGVPVTGSASYSGMILGDSTEMVDYGSWGYFYGSITGSIDLAFDFGAGNLTGSLHPYLTLEERHDLGVIAVSQPVWGVGLSAFSGGLTGPILSGAPAGITGQFTGPAAQELIGSFFFGYVSPVSGQDFSAAGAFIAQR